MNFLSNFSFFLFQSFSAFQVVDDRVHQKIHGGAKVHQLLKNNISPSVIRHEGRFKSNRPKLDESLIDSSFADLSMMSGDVSIQVIKNVKRM